MRMAYLDLGSSRFRACPFDVLVCPCPDVEVRIDMALALVHNQDPSLEQAASTMLAGASQRPFEWSLSSHWTLEL